MITSIDAERAFDKTQCPFMTKTPAKQGERAHPQLGEERLWRPTGNIVRLLPSGERSLGPGTRQGQDSPSRPPAQHFTRHPSNKTRQGKAAAVRQCALMREQNDQQDTMKIGEANFRKRNKVGRITILDFKTNIKHNSQDSVVLAKEKTSTE